MHLMIERVFKNVHHLYSCSIYRLVVTVDNFKLSQEKSVKQYNILYIYIYLSTYIIQYNI